jgi:Glycoside-hydrolase family GH114
MRRLTWLAAALTAVVTVVLPDVTCADVRRPVKLPPDAIADYQLGGSYQPPAKVNVVVRDSTELPAAGLYNICYVNGFQTQPGVKWPNDLVVLGADGVALVDPNWPDEHILNISSVALRDLILTRIEATISTCAMAGFDAVEFDNLDSYTRSNGALTVKDALAFARLLVRAAHKNGLAAGQKNAPEFSDIGRNQIGFDFVVAEECHRFDECAAYTRIYGDQVINIEYVGRLRGSFADACAHSQTPRNTLLRDLELLPPGNSQYAYDHC